MSKIIIALVLIAAVSANFLPRQDEDMFKFMNFVQKFNKEYSTYEEFHQRFEIFSQNLKTVTDHENLSPFMDRTIEEFSKTHLTLNAKAISAARAKMTRYTPTLLSAPESYDARDEGLVAHVKNQGQCGSCWAFSAVANIEGQYAKKNGKVVTFSEQELVDCDEVDQGCNGGLMDNAFQELERLGGLVTDKEYPYKGVGGRCNLEKSSDSLKVKIASFKDISQNEEEIARVLAENGPLSVALNANILMTYTGGVINPSTEECDPRGLNHGVTLIGYGTDENGLDYWIVRNSWGEEWGEKGYFRIARGTGACGINTSVSTSIIA